MMLREEQLTAFNVKFFLYPVKALAPSIEMPTRSDQLTHSEAMSTITASDLSLLVVLCRRD
jgi:hypothetical protein